MGGQTYTFCLPDIGEGVVEGEVIEWLKKEGDSVKQDEPVVTVMTDKATVELPSPYPGTIVKCYYQVGQIAIKDKPLYDITVAPDIVLQEKSVSQRERQHVASAHPEKASDIAQIRQSSGGEGVLALPKSRHLAKQLGIDINAIKGSGKDGRIRESDLRQGIGNISHISSPLRLEGDEEHALVGVRGLMARKMDQTRIPQFSYFEQVDVTRLIEMRSKFKVKADQEEIHLSYMPFFIRALSLTAKKYPVVNASIDMDKGKVFMHKVQNVGIAMATSHGLIVPVLKGVEQITLNDLIRSYEALKIKAQEGKLTSLDMKEATISVSNFGVLGGEGVWATPLISESEGAILAFARIREMPIAKSGQVVVKSILPVSWSFDHRLIDGELAAAISYYYCSLLRDPALLL